MGFGRRTDFSNPPPPLSASLVGSPLAASCLILTSVSVLLNTTRGQPRLFLRL